MILLPLLVATPLLIQDLDADGFTALEGDCCDTVAEINPAAYDVPGNGIDEDCSGIADDEPVCGGGGEDYLATAMELAEAMELCKFATGSDDWGLLSVALERTDGSPLAPSQQASVQTAYGTGGIVAQHGNTFVALSTGIAADATDPGHVNPVDGTDWGHNASPPVNYLAQNGGVLPSSMGCSGACPAGSGANDSVVLHLTLRVPSNATAFRYKLGFMTAEYLDYQCTTFNDYALVLLQSGAPGIPADGNIAFDSLGNPLSANNAFLEYCLPMGCNTCPQGTADLMGTGFEAEGGYTGWLQFEGPALPGETIDLRFMVFDVSDNIYDSMLFLDDFEWVTDPTPDCSIGTAYCPAAPNSQSAAGANVSASGSGSVSANDLFLSSGPIPTGEFGVFFHGAAQVMNPFGDGFQCTAAGIVRVWPPSQSDGLGNVSRLLDNTGPGGNFIAVGATRHFQCWFRDPAGGPAGFNLSEGYSVTFGP